MNIDIQQELFDFIACSLDATLEDASDIDWEGVCTPRVKVSLLLTNPHTGKKEVISEETCRVGRDYECR